MRPSWREYALLLAEAAASRSEDPYLKVGAVVLRPNHSVAGVGYNGAPAGVDLNWADRDGRRPFVIHAEVNALRYTTPAETAEGLLALTHRPCHACLPLVAAYGITEVVYRDEIDSVTYPPELLDDIARQLGLRITQLKKGN